MTIDLGTIAKGVDLNANVSTADGDDTVTMMADGIARSVSPQITVDTGAGDDTVDVELAEGSGREGESGRSRRTTAADQRRRR